jgi:hypothetical protein
MSENPFDLSSAPLVEPEAFVAGSFIAWRAEEDVDNALYGVVYDFRSIVGAASFTVNGTLVSTGVWSFAIPSATSAVFVAGEYQWTRSVRRISDSEKVIRADGFMTVFSATEDRRSHARIMIAKIESILENRADSDVSQYTIKGREITKMTVLELTTWRNLYRSELGLQSGKSSSTLQVRFSDV